jgi:hypothetical protein
VSPDPREQDGEWLDRVRAQLDADAGALDAASASRLNRARQRALAERPRARWLRIAVPAFALAGAFALAVPLLRAPLPAPQADSAEAFEVLVADDSLALYEDLEFYAWLDAEQENRATGG